MHTGAAGANYIIEPVSGGSRAMQEKRILLIATGGTIASLEGGHGLSPSIGSEELLKYVPEVKQYCKAEAIQLFNLDSTNITPEHWLQIVKLIESKYREYDGFVVTHGTDTMAYTSAALSYLIQNSPKPIVITGSQKSIASNDTDAKRNLIHSFLYASDPASHDVSLVFDGKVILGTRARKERSKSNNAFASVDYPELAVIRNRKIIRYLPTKQYMYGAEPVIYHNLEKKILLITLIPGMDTAVLDRMKNEGYRAVICQSFGMGGLPGGKDGAFATAMEKWLSSGRFILMMTQVPYEGSDMGVYEVGQTIKEKYSILEAYNMTLEAAVTKLMWVLGQTDDGEKVRELFYTSVQYDLIV